MRVPATALLVALVGLDASAGQPLAPELRGGASVLSGAEGFRLQYQGDNDGYALAFDPTGAQYDRWFSTATHLLVRGSLDPVRFRIGGPARLLVSASLDQAIHTPRSIEVVDSSELNGDRPYSGWLAGQVALDLLVPRPEAGALGYSQLGASIFVGTLGAWSLAGFTQKTSHWISRGGAPSTPGGQFPDPKGWDGSANAVGGVTADVSVFAETTIATASASTPAWLSFTSAFPGLLVLLGGRGDAGGALVAAAVNATVIAGLVGDPVQPKTSRFPLSAWVYARGEARAVAWNATIQQPLVDGTPGARAEALVGEISAGVVARFGVVELAYAQLWRTNEIASLPPASRTGQLIGQVVIALVF